MRDNRPCISSSSRPVFFEGRGFFFPKTKILLFWHQLTWIQFFLCVKFIFVEGQFKHRKVKKQLQNGFQHFPKGQSLCWALFLVHPMETARAGKTESRLTDHLPLSPVKRLSFKSKLFSKYSRICLQMRTKIIYFSSTDLTFLRVCAKANLFAVCLHGVECKHESQNE